MVNFDFLLNYQQTLHQTLNKNRGCVVYVPTNLDCQYNGTEKYAGFSLPSPVYVSTWGSNLHRAEKTTYLLVHILEFCIEGGRRV